MALRNLTLNKSQLTEKQIEDIVGDYIRYDTDVREVVLLPAAFSLSNRLRVLVYLVALAGWQFLVEDPVANEATPAQIELSVRVVGGTLRPILKDLKDTGLVSVGGRKYAARVAALPTIKERITAAVSLGSEGRPGGAPGRRRSLRRTPGVETREKDVKSRSPFGKRSEFFDRLISEGYFDTPRTDVDVLSRFHAGGHLVPRTSMPRFLLKAVRDLRLRREKSEVNGKKVWVYENGPDRGPHESQ